MNKKENEILSAIGELDGELIEAAKPRGRGSKAVIGRGIAIAASFVLVAVVVLLAGLIWGNNPPVEDKSSADQPFPEVPSTTKSLAAVMEDYLNSDYADELKYDLNEDDAEGGTDSSNSNGSYVEVTDNQVEGIIEGDIYKTTDKYIFRYRYRSLCIYSIDGESSKRISVTPIDSNGNKNTADMFLSDDGNTVTIIQSEFVRDGKDNYDESIYYSGHYITKIYSIDVSDVENPKINKTLEIYGFNKAVRKIGDKIYLVTSHSFEKNNIDIDDPATYIVGISGDEEHICEISVIYYPDEITSASYHYVTVFNESDMSLSSEYAILSNFGVNPSYVYFTDNHIVIEHKIGKKISEEESTSEAYSRIELIDFSGDTLRYRGNIEMSGWAESGQYSYDEKDGYLRVVVSTRTWKRYWVEKSNASLYIYDLSTMSLSASVENFAPEGERATAVRFENDKLYVCTAETAKFTDPVFYFDLSDYKNITQVNTGYIEGFSTSLIDLGEGYLVGIGCESVSQIKIEVYKRDGESVVSVAEYICRGNYDYDYHAYLIDREKNLVGLALNYTKEDYSVAYGFGYFLWHFDPETESLSLAVEISGDDDHTTFGYARAFVRDGYLYLTSANTFTELVVRKIEIK